MGFNTRTVVADISLCFTKIKRSETAQSYLDSEKVKVSSSPWDPPEKVYWVSFFLF